MSPPVRVLALDPALRLLGWAVSARPPRPRYGVAAGADHNTPLTRLHERAIWLGDMLRRYVPEVCTFEGYSYGSGGRAAVSLGELGGVLRLVAFQQGVPIAVVPPANLKVYACGSAATRGPKKVTKDDVVQAARTHLGYVGTSSDKADALWLWHMTRHHYDGQPAWTGDPWHKRHVNALAGCQWPTRKGDT